MRDTVFERTVHWVDSPGRPRPPGLYCDSLIAPMFDIATLQHKPNEYPRMIVLAAVIVSPDNLVNLNGPPKGQPQTPSPQIEIIPSDVRDVTFCYDVHTETFALIPGCGS